MKHIYLFNEGSFASLYGIGTYMEQLIRSLQGRTDFSLNVVLLHAEKDEFTIEKVDGVRTFYLPLVRRSFSTNISVYMRNAWYLLAPYIKTEAGDVLIFHLNYPAEYSFIEWMKRDFPFCRIVFTVHFLKWFHLLKGDVERFKAVVGKGGGETTEENQLYDLYREEVLLYQRVDQVICLAGYTYRLLRDYYKIEKEKIACIYNGLEDRAIRVSPAKKKQLKRDLGIPEDEKVVLYVGRMEDMKGFDLLLHTFPLVLEKYPDVRLLVAGDGIFSQYLAECKGFRGKVIFAGRVDKEELYRFYQLADVGVITSRQEQCSYVAIEMMMFALPMIISDIPALKEMTDQRVPAFPLSDKNDPSPQLAASIVDLLTRPTEIGMYGRKHYEEIFTLSRMGKDMERVYDSAFSDK